MPRPPVQSVVDGRTAVVAERDAARARPARRNPGGLPPGKRRDGSSIVSDHGPYTVSAGRIIGTDHVVFYAHEPYAGHSSMRTIEGRSMGQLGTRPLPPEIEALPGYRAREPGSGAERSAAVRKWHQDQYDDAYRAICAEWPEARGARRSDGSISLTDRELADLVSPEPWRAQR